MPASTAITLASSAARTASGAGTAVDLGAATAASIEALVTAVSGTSPTLDLTLQTSSDQTTWATLATLPRFTGAGRAALLASGALRYVRLVWTVGGTTPSFTFSAAGRALIVYATPTDLDTLGPSALANESVSNVDKGAALAGATGELDDYLNGRYTLPLTAWGDSLRQHTVNIAAYRLLVKRGWSPVSPEDETVRTNFNDALEWALLVKDEKIQPPDIIDSTPDVYDAGGFVVSKPKRGW